MTEAFRHRTPLQVRFRDTDAFGHVNNAVFATYVELARVRYLTEVLEPRQRFERLPLILARLEIDFRSPIQLGDEVAVETRVDRVGRSSVAMSHRMSAGPDGSGERLAAEVASVIVVYDYETERPIPVPDDWRARIDAFENRS
ncbi:MAG: acyl-CoA thioesterase [Chloroflexi bacterium]|nr:acyl-CoA thioesterase [Chloroflexota bacterium]